MESLKSFSPWEKVAEGRMRVSRRLTSNRQQKSVKLFESSFKNFESLTLALSQRERGHEEPTS